MAAAQVQIAKHKLDVRKWEKKADSRFSTQVQRQRLRPPDAPNRSSHCCSLSSASRLIHPFRMVQDLGKVGGNLILSLILCWSD